MRTANPAHGTRWIAPELHGADWNGQSQVPPVAPTLDPEAIAGVVEQLLTL
jgi:hypothetical protein